MPHEGRDVDVVVLVAATTENPSFSVIAPLLSRSILVTLESLTREEVGEVPGVTGVEVSHETGLLRVGSDAAVDEAAVLAAVEEAGYSAVRA